MEEVIKSWRQSFRSFGALKRENEEIKNLASQEFTKPCK